MKFRKTNTHNRTNYTYYPAEGAPITLFPESSRPNASADVTVYDERYVPDDMIRELHLADDRMVYSNNKNCKTPYAKWEKPILEEWQRQHPGEKPPKRYHKSLEAVISDESIAEDKLNVQTHVLMAADEEESPDIERLHEIVDSFSSEQKTIYRLVFLLGNSGREAARMLNIPESTMRRRVNEIRRIIAADPILKKMYGTADE